MALFDRFVRPPDETPPWGHAPLAVKLGRGCAISWHLVWQTFLILIFHLWGFRLPNPYGVLAYVFDTVILFNASTLWIDGHTGNGLGRNVENARMAGYTDAQLLAIMNANLLGSQFLGYVLVNYVCNDPTVYTWTYYATLTPGRVITMLGRMAVSLGCAELLFAAGHSLLHRSVALSRFHVLHHCCTHPTWVTNLLFHPVDLAIEFGGPAVALFALHFLCFDRDQASLLVTYLTFQLWYAFDHDEHLNMYHAAHHRHCDSLYVIYCNKRGDPSKNHLRTLMRETLPGLNWPSKSKQPADKMD